MEETAPIAVVALPTRYPSTKNKLRPDSPVKPTEVRTHCLFLTLSYELSLLRVPEQAQQK